MTTRYQKSQIEDVARILTEEKRLQETSGRAEAVPVGSSVLNLIYAFADLFAADNPPVCEKGANGLCTGRETAGFNREWFLAACGLEPESDMQAKLDEVTDHWEEGYPQGDTQ